MKPTVRQVTKKKNKKLESKEKNHTQSTIAGVLMSRASLEKQKSVSPQKNYQIDIVPDKSLLSRIGESGHTFYEAVAEFIDNSIDAKTPQQKSGSEKLLINIVINVKKKFFSISDNGRGMDKRTLANCARLGHSEKTALELGYAGIGIKSGALTLGHNYVVRTGEKGSQLGNEFEYDEQRFLANQNGWEIPARSFVKNRDDHGTTVTIRKVDKINLIHPKIQYLKNDIAKRYRSFIKKGNVVITVNKQEVKVQSINWVDGYPKDFKIPTEFGEIHGKIGLMKESSQKGYYGFDMFRNGRMIESNSKFAIGTHPTTARISGEIHLDFVKVSHEKNKFLTETVQYSVAEDACKSSSTFKAILREARKKSQEGDNKKENTIISSYINENIPIISYAIKELEYNIPTIDGKTQSVGQSKKGVKPKEAFDAIEKEKQRRVEKSKDEDKTTSIKSDKEKKERKEKKDDNIDIIEINGRRFKIVVEFFNEEEMGRKKTHLENGVFSVYINKLYAGFRLTKDKNAYCLETVQDAIIESMFADHQHFINEVNLKKEGLITAIYKYQEYFKKSIQSAQKEEVAEIV
jgi:hypothetical protein